MPMKRVTKTGVYRHENGHGVYLQEGTEVNAVVMDAYTFDGDATKDYTAEPERPMFGSVIDAPQEVHEQRAEQPIENRMDAPAENRSDAQLAAAAAKGTKK